MKPLDDLVNYNEKETKNNEENSQLVGNLVPRIGWTCEIEGKNGDQLRNRNLEKVLLLSQR